MNKETLIQLGLTEEVAAQVLEAHKESMAGFIPKARFDEVNDRKKQLEADLQDRDTQLEGLKGINSEELQAEITKLQEANETAKTEYETKLHDQAFTFAMKEALTGAKARNHKAVESLLNKDGIKLEEGSLQGLSEQLTALKESDAYLFEMEVQAPEGDPAPVQAPKFSVGGHASNSGSGDAFSKALLGK